MSKTAAIIADLHFGVLPDKQQQTELSQVFFHDLWNLEELDLIVLCGDTYDHKFYVNDPTTDLAIWFFSELCQLAIEKNAKVRIVYGTKSHEADQYNLLTNFQYETLDLKVIDHVSEEEIFPDVWVLYLPEEHIYSKNEYYNEYLYKEEKENYYTYVFGHGVIDEIMTTGPKQKESTTRLHVPHFTIGELTNVCKGEVYFGHYHVHSEYEDRVFYLGSYNRWEFGQEEPKGYMISELGKKLKHRFIENLLALKYKTLYYGYHHDIFKSTENLLVELERVENMIERGLYDKIRCMINIPLDLENPEFYVNTFKVRFQRNPNVKVDITNGYVEEKKKINKEELKDVVDNYHFVLEDLDISEKISRFGELVKDRKIDQKKVKDYLEKPLNLDSE